MKQFKNIIAIIKGAANKNQKQISFLKRHYNYKPILIQLQKRGLIKSFTESGNYILIRLKQPKVGNLKETKSPFVYLKAMDRYKKLSMKNKDIVDYHKMIGEAAITMFNTDQGIKYSETLSAIRIGGILILRVG